MKVLLRALVFGLLLHLPGAAPAQFFTRLGDTIHTSFHTKPKFFLGFDTRRSFISNRDVKIFGLRAGLEWNHRVRLGIGLYGLLSPYLRSYERLNDSTGLLDTIAAPLRFGYLSGFAEYVVVNKKRWELSVPLHLGLGSSRFEGFEAETEGGFLLTELSLQAQYKILKWIGLGGGVGYRWLIIPNNKVQEDFNSPIYIFKIKIFMGEIVKAVFKKKDE